MNYLPSQFNFATLKVDKPVVSIFASGFSAYSLAPEEYSKLQDLTYTVGTNGFVKKWLPRLHVWSDPSMTAMMDEWLAANGKKCLFCTKPEAFVSAHERPRVYNEIDYWFQEKSDKLDGNFTFYWVLQLFRKYFPDKRILVFGLDGDFPIDAPAVEGREATHGYDVLDSRFIKARDPLPEVLNVMANFMQVIHDRGVRDPEFYKPVFNCNPDSKFKGPQKTTWRAALGLPASP